MLGAHTTVHIDLSTVHVYLLYRGPPGADQQPRLPRRPDQPDDPAHGRPRHLLVGQWGGQEPRRRNIQVQATAVHTHTAQACLQLQAQFVGGIIMRTQKLHDLEAGTGPQTFFVTILFM